MKLTNRQLNKIKDIPFRYDLHYKMWDWISKHPDKCMDDYFAVYPNETHLSGKYQSFACAYADKVTDTLRIPKSCYYCPLKANHKGVCLNGLFMSWCFNINKEASKYAKQIRDLPLNPMFNFKDAE